MTNGSFPGKRNRFWVRRKRKQKYAWVGKQNIVEITAVNCKGTGQRNINRFYFIPVMSYSRTYRRSNGADWNQTNINASQRAGGTETGEGSHEEEVLNQSHAETSKQERQDCNRLYYLISALSICPFTTSLEQTVYPSLRYPGPRGFLLFFLGKFCDANRFFRLFFYR